MTSTGGRGRSDEDDPRRPVPVGSYGTRTEAELVRARLDAAGIAAWVAADDAGGAFSFDLSGGAQVVVAAQDLDAALAVLDDVGAS